MSEQEPQQSVHEQVLASMQELAEQMQQHSIQLRMPPPSMQSLGTRYTELTRRKSLTAAIPFQEEFTNPTGVLQGGFLSAAFDEVFGPLSYMVSSRPFVTIQMQTSFLRPFRQQDRVLTVRADVLTASRSVLLLQAQATRPDGKQVAIATAHCVALSLDRSAE